MTLKFTIEIECDNAAFAPESGGEAYEIARILRDLDNRGRIHELLNDLRTSGMDEYDRTLGDLNGNRVGTARFTKE